VLQRATRRLRCLLQHVRQGGARAFGTSQWLSPNSEGGSGPAWGLNMAHSENGHLVRRGQKIRRDVVAPNRSGAHWSGHSAVFPTTLCNSQLELR